MADRLSRKLRDLHDWFAVYARTGVHIEAVGVVVTVELLNVLCSDALALERESVEAAAANDAAAFEAERQTGAASQRRLSDDLRELSGVIADAERLTLMPAPLKAIRECVDQFARNAADLEREVLLAPARAQGMEAIRRADAVAEGLRSGKVARLAPALRVKRAAFSDGREGDAS